MCKDSMGFSIHSMYKTFKNSPFTTWPDVSSGAYLPILNEGTPLRVLPTPTPSDFVIGFLFWSGDGAGCVGGASDGVLRGSRCAEIKRTWRWQSCCCTATQIYLHT